MRYTFLKIISAFLLLFSFITIEAQSTVLDFTLTSDQINAIGVDVAIASTITKSGNTLVWEQNNNGNTDSTAYTIMTSNESWDTSTSTGNISYVLDIEGYPCYLDIEGTGLTQSATFTFEIDSTEPKVFILQIDTISYQ